MGKVLINDKLYYVRYTVSNLKKKDCVHSMFVTNIDVYENTAKPTYDTEFPSGRNAVDGVVDAKVQQFFALASADGKEKCSTYQGAEGKDNGNNISLTDEDISNIIEVLSMPGYVIFVDDSTGRKMLVFIKSASGKTASIPTYSCTALPVL